MPETLWTSTYSQIQGAVLPLETIRRLTPAEINIPVEDDKRKWSNLIIREKIGDSLQPPTPISEEPSKYDDVEELSKISEWDDFNNYDLYIDSEVLLPKNREHMRSSRVVYRTKNQYGKVISDHEPNPIFDTMIYDVMFPDGSIRQYAAKNIEEHMYSQVDKYGHRYKLL